MADFNQALQYLLQDEGLKITNDPADHGGLSSSGITLPTLAAYNRLKGLNPPTPDDLMNLTAEQRADVYKTLFWDPIGFPTETPQAVATAIFDIGVNMGGPTVARFAQEALGLNPDGIIGYETKGAIATALPIAFLTKFIPVIQEHYINIVINDPTQIKYLRGWLNRSLRLMTLLV